MLRLASSPGSAGCRVLTVVTLLETVRDAARDFEASEHLDELVDAAVEEFDEDPIPAGPLTDALLDIRNSCRWASLACGL